MDRNRHMATRTSDPDDFAHQVPASVSALDTSEDSRPVARTSRYHFAAAQTAEDIAAGILPNTWGGTYRGEVNLDDVPRLRAVRVSYYQLAAAHRNAAVRRARAERRAANRTLLRQDPARYLRLTLRATAAQIRYASRHAARTIRGAVSR